MKIRYLIALSCLIVALASPSGSALAQESPEFKLGFKLLAGQIPTIVGNPLENERHNPHNGDSLQKTSKGLMVWRKADNWTAFTDGHRTWVNGPYGLQERYNDQRFPWEQGASAASATIAGNPYKIVPLPTTQTPAAQQFHTPTVKAMDEESTAQSGVISAFVRELDAKWATVWGWRPRKPVSVYIYFDGYRMAEGIASISGMALTSSRKDEIATTVAGMKSRDRQTGGWAVFMNLNKWYGTDRWAIRARHLFTHEYTHVMQSDAAGSSGPTWFNEGMAELSAFVEVPEAAPFLSRTKYVVLARDRDQLPSLRYLATGWQEMIKARGERAQLAYGMAYLAVKYLSDRVGGMPLLQVLEKTAGGQGFESALQEETGFTLDRLDAEYRQSIPASPAQP